MYDQWLSNPQDPYRSAEQRESGTCWSIILSISVDVHCTAAQPHSLQLAMPVPAPLCQEGALANSSSSQQVFSPGIWKGRACWAKDVAGRKDSWNLQAVTSAVLYSNCWLVLLPCCFFFIFYILFYFLAVTWADNLTRKKIKKKVQK